VKSSIVLVALALTADFGTDVVATTGASAPKPPALDPARIG
jgi:hypothetical protein